MRKLTILFYCILISLVSNLTSTHAQTTPLPPDLPVDLHQDFSRLTPYVLPCINWLQQTPLGNNKKERSHVHEFVMHWLERNPDLDISLPDYSLLFHRINREFLYLFMEGWIKYSLETKDNNHVACNIAGLHSMLNFYLSGKAVGVGKVDYLEHLASIDSMGKLAALFDTGHTATNTFLYLTAPVNKHQFRHDENYFSFQFYSINLLQPRGVNYRYMLGGYYDEWITTNEGSVIYPRLSPGNYIFTVQASMTPDFSNAVSATYSFSIARPIWKEYWFIILCALGGFFIVYAIVKQRERNLKNIAQLKHERVIFEYEHLKSQVNPHFLFNSLNTLTNLISKDKEAAMDYTEKLSELYHSILAYRENDFVSLSEEIGILQNYISVQKGRFGNDLQLKVDISENLLNRKKIIPLALQILIENVIKHNVISASEPLVIVLSATESEITIRNRISPKLSKEKGGGLGLMNLKRRYELLTRKRVTYGVNGDEYIVKLPLL